MPQTPPRTLSPYESTQLARHGLTPQDLLSQGELPVEYLTGHVTFYQHDFLVNSSTLIPRIESETLVKLAADEALVIYLITKKPLSIIDVGTGSGAVGISLALELEKQHIPFNLILSDISVEALAVTKQNITHLVPHLALHIQVVQSDLLSQINQGSIFDLLVANLPYIPHSRINYLPKSVKDYEPHVALDGGSGGLELMEKFLLQAKKHLSSASVILMEVDYLHTHDVLRPLAPELKLQMILDEFSKNRFARFSLK